MLLMEVLKNMLNILRYVALQLCYLKIYFINKIMNNLFGHTLYLLSLTTMHLHQKVIIVRCNVVIVLSYLKLLCCYWAGYGYRFKYE